MVLMRFFFALVLISLNILDIKGDFSRIVLDQPGTYKIGARQLNVTDPNDCFIYINSNDVVLDMENTTLVYTGTVAGYTGIYIAPALSNVTIQNAVFKNLTGYGIYISDGCSDILIDSVVTSGCQAGGIISDGSTYGVFGVSIEKSAFSSTTGVNNGPACGGIFNHTTFIDMVHVYFTNNYSYTAPGYGAYFNNSATCHFTNTVFIYNGGTPLGVGAYFKNCSDCKILYCAGSNNYTLDNLTTSSAIGFVYDSTKTSGMAYCIASNNASQYGCGIGYSGTNGSSNVFDQCDSQGNVGGNIGAGFVLTGNENAAHILQSYAFLNKGGNAAYGVLFDGATECSVLNSVLNNNKAPIGLAYLDTSTSSNNIIKHNLYYNNSTQADCD